MLDSGMCYTDYGSEAALRYGFSATLLAIQRVVHAYLAVPKNTYDKGDRHVLEFYKQLTQSFPVLKKLLHLI